MQLSNDLRPPTPKHEPTPALGESRERGGSDALRGRSRFDEQLTRIAGRKDPARDPQSREPRADEPHATNESERTRRPETNPHGDSGQRANGGSSTPIRQEDEPDSPEGGLVTPGQTAKLPAQDAAAADPVHVGRAKIEEPTSQPGGVELPVLQATQQISVPCALLEELPAQSQGQNAAAGQSSATSQEALAAALFAMAQASSQLVDAAPAQVSPTAIALPVGTLDSDAGVAPANPTAADGLALDAGVAPTPVGDQAARAGLESIEGGRRFEGELARLRTSEAGQAQTAQTAQPTRTHSEQAAEILRQVRVGLSPDMREANIQLAPEALGRVSIRLRVEAGVLSAEVRAESPQALRALERHAPELRAALAAHGVEPRALEFQLGFTNSQTGNAPGHGPSSHSRSPRASSNPFSPAPAALERALARGLSVSGIDTYA